MRESFDELASPLGFVFTSNDLGYDGCRRFLKDVDLDIRAGDLIAMAGPNGSGKTTIFRTILGFLARDQRFAGAQLRAQRVRLRAAELGTGLDVSDHRARSGGDGRLWPAKAVSEVYRRREKQRLDDVLEQVGLAILQDARFFRCRVARDSAC